jgi:hypothetical protein
MIAGMNPWLTMWSQPRSTIRALVHSKPTYGVLLLASIYALQSFFFYANWWSLGLHAHYYTLLVLGVLLSPLMGFIWLYFNAWLLHFTGLLFRGHASSASLRTALAWSNLPTSINLLPWILFLILDPAIAFIQDAGGPPSIFLNLISFILSLWSLILLIQCLCELQSFTPLRSLLTILLTWILSSITFMLVFGLVRYIYLKI